jgi:hypothetical protein
MQEAAQPNRGGFCVFSNKLTSKVSVNDTKYTTKERIVDAIAKM